MVQPGHQNEKNPLNWLKRILSVNPTLFSADLMQLPSQEDEQPSEPLTTDPPASASSLLLLHLASVHLPPRWCMTPAPNISEELSNGQHTVPVASEILAALSPSTMCGTPTTLSAGVEPPASLNRGQSVLPPSTVTYSVSSDTGKKRTLAQPSHVFIPP